MDPTPFVVISAVVLVLLWKTGALGNLLARLRGNSQPRPGSVAMTPTNMANPQPGRADRETSPEELASRYGVYLLGLAHQIAVKREAEYNLMHDAAVKSADQARTAWQAPFGGTSRPGPPQPGGMPPGPPSGPSAAL